MIVDHVQNHRHTGTVTGIDQHFELIRSAVRVLDGVRIDAVVAPVTVARELGNRHDFNRTDAKLFQIAQSFDCRRKRPFRRERTHVQFIDHHLLQAHAAPVIILPIKSPVIEYLAGPVNTFRLKVRRRVGPCDRSVESEKISSAGLDVRKGRLPVTGRFLSFNTLRVGSHLDETFFTDIFKFGLRRDQSQLNTTPMRSPYRKSTSTFSIKPRPRYHPACPPLKRTIVRHGIRSEMDVNST